MASVPAASEAVLDIKKKKKKNCFCRVNAAKDDHVGKAGWSLSWSNKGSWQSETCHTEERRVGKKAPVPTPPPSRSRKTPSDSYFCVAAAKWQSLETPNVCNAHSLCLSLQAGVKSTILRGRLLLGPLEADGGPTGDASHVS